MAPARRTTVPPRSPLAPPSVGTATLPARIARVTTGSDGAAALAGLADLDLQDLRTRWRMALGGAPPRHLTRALLLRLLAYRIQVRAEGDLDPATRSLLDRIGRAERKRLAGGDRGSGNGEDAEGGGAGAAGVPPPPPARLLPPGTLLVREHRGALHRVMVVAGGFAWRGAIYRSLSEVARAITGTRWNGPRFFGLTERGAGRRNRHGALDAELEVAQ